MSALLSIARSQWLVNTTRVMSVVTGVVTPLLFLTLLVLPRIAGLGREDATAVLTGVLLASLWAGALWSSVGILRRERWDGTLAPSVIGRIPPLTVMIGKTVGATLYDLSLVIVTSAAFIMMTGVDLTVRAPAAMVLGLFCVVLGSISSSLLLGTALILSRHAHQLTTAVGTPILLLGGTIVPHSYLPDWLAAAGNVINLAWFQRFLASTATGQLRWDALAIALLLSAAYAALGSRLLRVILHRAQREGTLELV